MTSDLLKRRVNRVKFILFSTTNSFNGRPPPKHDDKIR